MTTPAEPKDNVLFSPEAGLVYVGGDRDAYLEVLEMYVNKSEEKRRQIQMLFEKKDLKNYVIEVHALKSSSLSIGAKKLSERAKELELAGKEGNYSLIEEKNAAMLEMYGQVAGEGRKYLAEMGHHSAAQEETDISALTEITEEKLAKHIEKILEACGSFDVTAVCDICGEAAKYRIGSAPLRDIFAEIKRAADDFDYDAVGEKARGAADKFRRGR